MRAYFEFHFCLGWYLNLTTSNYFYHYFEDPSSKVEKFRLYKPKHRRSSEGEFVHAKERYWCGDLICIIDPERDPGYIPYLLEPNYWILRLNSDLGIGFYNFQVSTLFQETELNRHKNCFVCLIFQVRNNQHVRFQTIEIIGMLGFLDSLYLVSNVRNRQLVRF